MSSQQQPPSSNGLPSSPRATRQTLSPLTTTFSPPTPTSPYQPTNQTTTSASSSASTLVPPPQSYHQQPHSHSSLIFINATIPLSPTSSTSSSPRKGNAGDPYDGLQPRQRNGFARLFSCFGRRERARRRREGEVREFEKVGGGGHWSEW